MCLAVIKSSSSDTVESCGSEITLEIVRCRVTIRLIWNEIRSKYPGAQDYSNAD